MSSGNSVAWTLFDEPVYGDFSTGPTGFTISPRSVAWGLAREQRWAHATLERTRMIRVTAKNEQKVQKDFVDEKLTYVGLNWITRARRRRRLTEGPELWVDPVRPAVVVEPVGGDGV